MRSQLENLTEIQITGMVLVTILKSVSTFSLSVHYQYISRVPADFHAHQDDSAMKKHLDIWLFFKNSDRNISAFSVNA